MLGNGYLLISRKSQNILEKRRQHLNENKRNTVKFRELNKTIRKQIEEDMKKITMIRNEKGVKDREKNMIKEPADNCLIFGITLV